jgi:RimJ/RimL family protein N-acetyltransferase
VKGIRFNHADDAEKISKACKTHWNPITDICIARVEKGKLYGGIIYKDYTGKNGSVAMHVAAFLPRWVNRTILWVAFDYPFNQLGVKKVFGQVPADNEAALKFDLNLGFKVEGQIKDVYPSGDMLLLSMYRAECRFLQMKAP